MYFCCDTISLLGISAVNDYQILSNIQKQLSRGVLKKRCSEIWSKFTGEQPCQSVISIKLLCNFIEIHFGMGVRSPVNLLHIFITPFPKNTSEQLLLNIYI